MRGTLKKILPTWFANILRFILKSYKCFKFKSKRLWYTIKMIFGGIIFTHLHKYYRNDDVKIKIPTTLTDYKFRGRFFYDTYEVEERQYLKKYITPNATVLELGSCIGFVSVFTNKLLNDPSKHVVVEANPYLIEHIKYNRDINNSKFQVFSGAISKKKKETFSVHNLIVGGSTKRETGHKIEVNCGTFKELKSRYNLNFDTLIMDIEGGELYISENFKSDLKTFKIIMMEIHPFMGILSIEEAKKCEDNFKSIGFELLERNKNVLIWKNTNE